MIEENDETKTEFEEKNFHTSRFRFKNVLPCTTQNVNSLQNRF